MDAILLNGTRISPIGHAREFHFSIRPHALLSLHEFSKLKPTMNSDAQPDAVDKALKSVTAALGATVKRLLSSGNPRLMGIAGIADPQRFADTLAAIGLHCPVQALGDHAQLDAGILRTIDADIIVMTAKDAVKLLHINDPRCWVLLVEAEFDPGFFPWLLENIEPLIESSTHG